MNYLFFILIIMKSSKISILEIRNFEKLFENIAVDTPVVIVNQPYKVGWQEDKLYVETHSDIEEQEKAASRNLTEFVQLVVEQTKNLAKEEYQTFWERGYKEAKLKRGVPFVMSLRN